MVVKMFKKILTRKKAPVSNRKYTKKNTKKKSKKVGGAGEETPSRAERAAARARAFGAAAAEGLGAAAAAPEAAGKANPIAPRDAEEIKLCA